MGLLYICISCTSKNKLETKTLQNNIRGPEIIYISGKNNFDNQNYEKAKLEFVELKNLYPLSDEAIQAEIMIGFISYVQLDYDDAIKQFEKIMHMVIKSY